MLELQWPLDKKGWSVGLADARRKMKYITAARITPSATTVGEE